jgi:uncharacterized protein (TIGR03435 family)
MMCELNGKRCGLVIVGALVLIAEIFAGLGISVRAQSAGQGWEKAAGGKQQFEVASVRQNKSGGDSYSNFNLDGGSNAYWVIDRHDPLAPGGDLFTTKNIPLIRYIVFAYRLSGTQELALRFDFYEGLRSHVPAWVKDDRYDMDARAPGLATKDQMRLMMQSLLAERFQLKAHWETREVPVFALVEEKAGKVGPQLEAHPASDNCAKTDLPESAAKTAASAPLLSALPIPCGWIAHLPASGPGSRRFGGRNVTLAMLGTSMPAQTGLVTLPRPMVDRTGLKGGYDFWMEWTPEDTSEVNNTETGGTFREALKNQLGLKLEPAKGPVQVLVIDHVEQPTAN